MIRLTSSNMTQAAALQFLLWQSQQWSKPDIEKNQKHSLVELYNFSKSTVPYYRDNPAYPSQVSNWLDIPILTRSELQGNFEVIQSLEPLKHHGNSYEFRTSGSTGRPVKILTTEYAQYYWRAFTVRSHLWPEKDFTKNMAIIKFLANDQARLPGVESKIWGPSSAELYDTGKSFALNSLEPIEDQYNWLCRIQPEYLTIYPSALAEISKIQLKQNRLKSLKGISTLGENVTPHHRELVREAFGLKIDDMYSSQEVGYIALQCPKHDHYHIQIENCYVEVLNEEGQLCKAGEMGKVVITPYHNLRMPLIRYEIGDYAIMGGDCDCGITSPTLQQVIGRTRNLVTYPNGKKAWPSYNPMKLMELFDSAQFQLEQNSLEYLTLRIQTSNIIDEQIAKKAEKIIQAAIEYPFTIEVKQVDHIERSASGKYEEFVSRI